MALNFPNLPSSAFSRPRAKITANQRNAIYALRHVRHVSPDILADVFGVSRITIHQIASQKTKSYQDVAFVANDIGPDAMYARYVTQDMLDKIAAIAQADSPRKAQALQDTERAAAGEPNQQADKYRGEHRLPLRISGEFHTIDIQWKEETDSGNRTKARGWHVAHPRAGWPGWFGDADNKPFATSKAAHAFAQTESLTLYMADPA